ncbi:MAG TPA: response regulator transcription factor [Leucothrix mucor]|uniref:Response regulator transcription factor n=1 Tax=Leucothrix mucor TaxID=45248 RepID=A0A7V2WUV5_LEUMU|nr:response regulator transcription factor [Leucothrix mucor]
MYILAIEDNPDLVENLYDFFEARGHTVDAAYDGNSGLMFVEQNSYDVVVLDLMLPDIDGLKVCSTLRGQGCNLPILMLTARDTLDDKLLGFNSGADDYLVKPFSLQELKVRLQALVRRGQGNISNALLSIADLTFNPATLKVCRAGYDIELPPIPLKILELLMRQSPRVVTRREIERYIWGDDLPETDSLRAHLHTLRTLIDKPFTPHLLQTMRGMGYHIAQPNEF